VGLNSAWYQSNPALYYLRNSLRGLGMRVRIREFALSEQPMDILATLIGLKPDVICFSAYVWNRGLIQLLIPELRKLLPKAKIVLGGPEADSPSLQESPDFVLRGPGEGIFRLLAESGFSLPRGIHEAPAPHLQDLPFPYRASDKPALQNKLIYYETSRGCPFRCVYCLSALDTRNEARFDPALSADRKRLFAELDRLVALEPRTLKFVDRSFNAHPGLARLIWKYALERGQSCEFHFEIYPGLLAEEDIRLLEKAPPGRIRFEIGIQTTNPEVATNCGRASDWPKARNILLALRQRTQVRVHADLLAGLPGENISSIFNSLDELAALFPHEIQLGLLKILPHTPMRDIASQRGYLWMDDPPYQVLASDALSFAEISELHDLARAINLYWNKAEFIGHWEDLLKSGKPASELFIRLRSHHYANSLPLHSISRQARAEIFAKTLLI